ncbi:MAG: SHOCT domain-containing protein [Stenotrophomonas sp.]|uniref:SHOCT domain-containing protein n=1 Tax=Stenotrophomonas sp. TaxID=69392 RepID=UPI0028AEA426|nr:SHOCT domain-containing protein [Stenotrophomonas sp.]
MNVPGLEGYNWAVWLIGVLLFAVAIGVFIAAIVRAGKRPPELHSAAERLQREAAQGSDVDAKLRALEQRRQAGQMGEAEYEAMRAAVLAGVKR